MEDLECWLVKHLKLGHGLVLMELLLLFLACSGGKPKMRKDALSFFFSLT